MNRIITILFVVGAVFFAISIAYAILAPSPVDVLVEDYKDGYGYKRSTSSQQAPTAATSTRDAEAPAAPGRHEASADDDSRAPAQPSTETADRSAAAAATAAVREALAAALSVDPATIEIGSIGEREWPDGCLGIPAADESCTMAIVPGYRIEAAAGAERFIYRTDRGGSNIRKE